jgi:ATP-dependent protease ClpP protease subunit
MFDRFTPIGMSPLRGGPGSTQPRPNRDRAARLAERLRADIAHPASVAGPNGPSTTIKMFGLIYNQDQGDGCTDDFICSSKVRKQLAACREAGAEDITLLLNSRGGSFDASRKIYMAVRAYPGRISARIVGSCSSASLIPLMAADHREAVAGATMLLHRTEIMPVAGRTRWTADQHVAAAAAVRQADKDLAKFLSDKTGFWQSVFEEEMKSEHRMSLARAQKLGLIHAVLR